MAEASSNSNVDIGWIWTLISSIFGIIGNVLCVIVLSQPAMRKHATTMFMIGLSLSDAVFLIIRVLLLYWPSTVLVYNLVHVGMTCSAYFTILINVDRFIAVAYPFKAKSICTKERAIWLSIATLVTCFVVFQLAFWALHFSNSNSGLARYPDLICAILIFVIPFPILVVLNIRIGIELRKVSKGIFELDQSTSENRRKRRELSLTRMLFVVVVFFAISYAPYHLSVLSAIIFHVEIPYHLKEVNLALLQLNSCGNFIIYFAMGQQFRTCFKRVFGCTKNDGQDTTGTSSSAAAAAAAAGTDNKTNK